MVLTDELQSENRIPPQFAIEVMPFEFGRYRRRIKELQPDVVILFLHLKDRISWPLIHWLKLSGIPFASWTKTRNLDDPHNRWKNLLFGYVNSMSDALILYSGDLTKYLTPRQRRKAFVANNTVNHEEFPLIATPKAELKRELGIPFEKVVLFVGRMGEGGRKTHRLPHRDVPRVSPQRCRPRHRGLRPAGRLEGPDRSADHALPRRGARPGEPADREIFSMADLCVIPGHVGLGLNQALFYGLPVVTMEGKQPPEIAYLHHGQNGYIVPPADRKELEPPGSGTSGR